MVQSGSIPITAGSQRPLARRDVLADTIAGRHSSSCDLDFKTAWESLLLIANGHETKRAKPGARVDRAKLRQIDLHWHDLRHEGACRLLAEHVDIRTIQLMLGHADIKQTQRYLNITDEELRKAMTGVWERRRQLPGGEPVAAFAEATAGQGRARK
jgi:integrase